jgi:hypothetical protein
VRVYVIEVLPDIMEVLLLVVDNDIFAKGVDAYLSRSYTFIFLSFKLNWVIGLAEAKPRGSIGYYKNLGLLLGLEEAISC